MEELEKVSEFHIGDEKIVEVHDQQVDQRRVKQENEKEKVDNFVTPFTTTFLYKTGSR